LLDDLVLPAWLDGALLAVATNNAPGRNKERYMIRMVEIADVVDRVAALEKDAPTWAILIIYL
jgi:hypothetical protein